MVELLHRLLALPLTGQHMNQPYVQPSVILLREMRRVNARAVHEGSILPIKMPYVHWMPYLATGMSKLPPSPQDALRPLDALPGHRYVKTPSIPSRCPASTGCPTWPQVYTNSLHPLKMPYVHWMPYLATGMSKLPPSPQDALCPLDALPGHRYVKTPSIPSRCPMSTGCPTWPQVCKNSLHPLKMPYVHWMPYLATNMSKLPPSPQDALRPLDALPDHRYVKTPSLPSRCPTSTGCPTWPQVCQNSLLPFKMPYIHWMPYLATGM